MMRGAKLSALFEAEAEPSHQLYKEVVDLIMRDPQWISSLSDDDIKLSLTNRGDRFAKLFSHLGSQVSPQSPKCGMITEKTTALLTVLIPDLCQLLGSSNIVEILVPALSVCLMPSQPMGLSKLASALSDSGDLLEHLACDPAGSEVILQWVSLPKNLALDSPTQATWADKLVDMIRSCIGDHEIAPVIHKWDKLKALVAALQSLETTLSKQENDRRLRSQIPDALPSIVGDHLKGLLKVFDLSIPGSRRMIQVQVDTLLDLTLSSILYPIVQTFPCKRCIKGLGSPPKSVNVELQENQIEGFSDLHLDILGKVIGIWKLLLSVQAWTSIQKIRMLGLFGPVQEKLIDLTSGHISSHSPAGSAVQRKLLKVPLAKTKCGREMWILWQVFTGIAGDMQIPQQTLLVWDVGDSAALSKTIDRVKLIQSKYSSETVRRCRQSPTIANGRHFPLQFEDYDLQLSQSENSSTFFDVRTIDKETIDLASKFFALTEQMLRSVIENDLTAEFPFDLSRIEAQCISHFKTATLIMGRSGTGKTTCLVFKLVGKYLASKKASGGTPARQTLLTRSPFLAEKLKSYTKRLIRTLGAKNWPEQATDQSGEHDLSYTMEDHHSKNSVLNLNDQSFPLICTFDQFLELLENTVVALDRQNFQDVHPGSSFNSHQFGERTHHRQQQLIDFSSFKLDYWPRFSQKLTKGFSAHLVFSEIMGVIKGSESSRDSLKSLSRDEYLKRSSRLAPTFDLESDRLRVYEIFDTYERLKNEYESFDGVDRVVKLVRAISQKPSLMRILQEKFHEVYIDEIQDQRCLDLELLMKIVRDGRGFHLAGDTAQAISQDSTFRFADVKKMLFDHFASASQTTNQAQLGQAEMFLLSVNYRSHIGILSMASHVMDMIWKGFPETVDKLQPEIGNRNGPKPLLLVGCDARILLSSLVASGESSERSGEFGAEQAILVRDHESKENLQNLIGDIALVFTILESKGMEFDDVILWNLFSDCQDQTSLRSLSILNTDSAAFDAQKNSGMCSELKRLYVAVTRARNQLFIVESSEDTASTVQNFLINHRTGALADISRSDDEDFTLQVDMMRPKSTVDPIAWALRAEELKQRKMFREAMMSYRRAGDRNGEKMAQALLDEEEARSCHAAHDIEASTRHFEAAYTSFIEMDCVDEAIRVLLSLERPKEAAELCRKRDRLLEAADLFLKAGSYLDAVSCYKNIEHYAEVIKILRSEQEYNHLVAYVDENKQNIPAKTLRECSLLCKILLQRNKVSSECRKSAINLLGSLKEQEDCFLQYDMNKELEVLYKEQQRHKELYCLYTRTGQLDLALGLAVAKKLIETTSRVKESELIEILDYIWAGNIITGSATILVSRLKNLKLTANMVLRNREWEAILPFLDNHSPHDGQNLLDLDNSRPKKLMNLQKIHDKTLLTKAESLDTLPIETIQEAVKGVESLVFNEESDVCAILLLASGCWKTFGTQTQCRLLPWSPFQGRDGDMSITKVIQLAKQSVFEDLAGALIDIDLKARKLWSLKWPEHCVHFQMRGFYPLRSHRCKGSHEDFSSTETARILQDLLRVNSLFCGLMRLYRCRTLSSGFQEKYLGIRRHWLERLWRQLSFVSSVEQSALSISKIREQLLNVDRLRIIHFSLEELLYFRVGKEWTKRGDYTSLLEQMQQAEFLGSNVQYRLFRAVSFRLSLDSRHNMQRHLALMNSLLSWPLNRPVQIFESNLKTFLRGIDNIAISGMSTLYSLTGLFERLATYLILINCSSTCLLSQSMIDQHLPSIKKSLTVAEILMLNEPQRYAYQQCLVELVSAFCKILHRMNGAEVLMVCNGTMHRPLMLEQRNMTLLVIAMLNLGALSPLPSRFGHTWRIVNEVLEKDGFGKQLISRRLPDLAEKIGRASSHFQGKDGLILTSSNGKICSAFDKLVGIKTIPLDQLCPNPPTPNLLAPPFADIPAVPLEAEAQDYTSAETQAITKAQRLWRSHRQIVNARRAHLMLPEGQIIAHMIELSASCHLTISVSDEIRIRKILVSEGVAIRQRLVALEEMFHQVKKDSTAFLENIEIRQGIDESVDVVLSLKLEADSLLVEVRRRCSDTSLREIVKSGNLLELQNAMEEADQLLDESEKLMQEARESIISLTK